MSKQKQPIYIFEGDTKPFLVQLEDSEEVQFVVQSNATVTAYLRRPELVVDDITGVASEKVVANGPLVSCANNAPGADFANGIISVAYAANDELKDGIFDLVVVVSQSGTVDSFIKKNLVTVHKKVVFA